MALFTKSSSLHEDTYIPSFSKYQEFKQILTEAIDPDEGYGNKLRPVFVVLTNAQGFFAKMGDKFVKDQPYWHAAMTFSPNLSHLYSFNIADKEVNLGGSLSFQSIDYYKKTIPEGDLEVSCVFVTTEKYKLVKEALDYYIKNKNKTHYDYLNLVRELFGKSTPDKMRFNLVCSQFVDIVLKHADIKISDKATSNIVKPSDLRYQGKEKHFLLYKGKVKDFDADKLVAKVDKLSNDVHNDYFKDRKEDEDKSSEKDEKKGDD